MLRVKGMSKKERRKGEEQAWHNIYQLCQKRVWLTDLGSFSLPSWRVETEKEDFMERLISSSSTSRRRQHPINLLVRSKYVEARLIFHQFSRVAAHFRGASTRALSNWCWYETNLTGRRRKSLLLSSFSISILCKERSLDSWNETWMGRRRVVLINLSCMCPIHSRLSLS